MAERVAVKASARTGQGSSQARRVRRGGDIPAVVYGHGQPAQSIQVPAHAFELMLHRHTSESLLVNLEVDGAARLALLKQVQHHPVTGRIVHVDFQEIGQNEPVEVEIPLHLTGIPTGVSTGGGMLEHLVRSVAVSCLPDDMIEQLDVDVSGLGVGDHLAVSDLPLDPAKYEVLTAPDIHVVAVLAPRKEEEEEAPAEEGAEVPTEPEVIGETKAEEE